MDRINRERLVDLWYLTPLSTIF